MNWRAFDLNLLVVFDGLMQERIRALANLPAAPTLKAPEQEEEADGGILVTILEDTPLDVRA